MGDVPALGGAAPTLTPWQMNPRILTSQGLEIKPVGLMHQCSRRRQPHLFQLYSAYGRRLVKHNQLVDGAMYGPPCTLSLIRSKSKSSARPGTQRDEESPCPVGKVSCDPWMLTYPPGNSNNVTILSYPIQETQCTIIVDVTKIPTPDVTGVFE
ncbi:hypothetical protein BDW71DRAFT_208927 [Aspergillus fruticulosus]